MTAPVGMKDPRNIPESVIEALACGMHGFNAIKRGIFAPWDSVPEEEKKFWKSISKGGLIAAARFMGDWEDYKERKE